MRCTWCSVALAGLMGLALGLLPATASAQTFTKPVKIIVPFAPGGTSDILARLIGPKLQDAIGQPVVVENKTGAGGNIGADFVAKADKDGHTLLLIDVSTLAISPNLMSNMTYSPTKDLAPVGLISFAPYVLAVHPSVPVKTVAELVAHAKANPGKVPFGNAGIGVANHISAVQLEKTWGVEFKHVPYRGGADAIKGTVSGESQVHPQRRDGDRLVRRAGPIEGSRRLRRQARRKHQGPADLQGAQCHAGRRRLVAGAAHHRGHAGAVQERLNAELNKILAMPDIAKRIEDLGGELKAGPAAALAKWIETNTASYGAIIKDAGIKVQ